MDLCQRDSLGPPWLKSLTNSIQNQKSTRGHMDPAHSFSHIHTTHIFQGYCIKNRSGCVKHLCMDSERPPQIIVIRDHHAMHVHVTLYRFSVNYAGFPPFWMFTDMQRKPHTFKKINSTSNLFYVSEPICPCPPPPLSRLYLLNTPALHTILNEIYRFQQEVQKPAYHQILFLFMFFTSSQHHWNWGCTNKVSI